MSEQIATHIVLNAGAHHMTIIVDRKSRPKFTTYKAKVSQPNKAARQYSFEESEH